MFAIPFNFPFRKNDGSVSTIGAEISGGGGGGYVLPPATASTLGGIKVGNNLTIDSAGKLDAPTPTPPYTLPVASDENLGGIKVGANLSIDENGVLSANGGVTPTVDTITLDSTTASGVLKMVKGDDGFIKVAGAIDLASAFTTDRVRIAVGIPEKYHGGSLNTNWINLKVYLYDNYFDNMKESHAEIFGNGNVWIYYPTGVSTSFRHVYISGIYRNDVYNGNV